MQNKQVGYTSEYVGISKAAQLLGVSANTVRRYEDNHKIESIRTPGGHRKFSTASLKEYLANKPVSTNELAQKKHVSPSTIRRWKRQNSRPAKSITKSTNNSGENADNSNQPNQPITSKSTQISSNLTSTPPSPLNDNSISPVPPAKSGAGGKIVPLLIAGLFLLLAILIAIFSYTFIASEKRETTPAIIVTTPTQAIQQGITIIPAGSQTATIYFTEPFTKPPSFTINGQLSGNTLNEIQVSATKADISFTKPSTGSQKVFWQAVPSNPDNPLFERISGDSSFREEGLPVTLLTR